MIIEVCGGVFYIFEGCISHISFFFFLMIRRPPRSTLFPTRRSSDLNVDILAESLDTSSHLPASGTAYRLIVSKIFTDL